MLIVLASANVPALSSDAPIPAEVPIPPEEISNQNDEPSTLAVR